MPRQVIESIAADHGICYDCTVCLPGAAVTTRGSYYPPGKEAGSDKLHLLVEAPDQMALTKAKGEIKRIVGKSDLL